MRASRAWSAGLALLLLLTPLTGCQGVNGGGWAHYVGQEKVRPITGYTQIANALDWNRPPRNMIQPMLDWGLDGFFTDYTDFGRTVVDANAPAPVPLPAAAPLLLAGLGGLALLRRRRKAA